MTNMFIELKKWIGKQMYNLKKTKEDLLIIKLKPLYFKSFLYPVIILSFFSFSYSGDTIQCKKGEMFEIQLSAAQTYTQPYLDVTLYCAFSQKNQATITIPAFWNGGNQYLVRYSFQQTGTWSYTITCDNSTDSGLNNKQGIVIVNSNDDSKNLFITKGRPVVSNTKHYLTYQNGDPFFYLSCTCWELTWKSNLEQVKRYISNRKQKNFNTFQLVAISHQIMNPYGIINRNGDSTFLNNDFYMPNPKYMLYLDSIVKAMNDSGMIAAIDPLWAGTCEPNYLPQYWANYLTKDQALKWAKYIGSRYAGSNVIWIIGGDSWYDTVNGRNVFWSNYAQVLKNASGPNHLAFVHPAGGGSSSEYYDNTTSWLDFQAIQSSHIAGTYYTWEHSLHDYAMTPVKPVLNDECVYEDIYNNLWEPGDTVSVNTFRIRPEHIRQAQFESVLSGAIVGISYGANGLFQWNVPGLFGSHNPSCYADSAWNFPGSYQMTVARAILEKYRWYEFHPAQLVLKSSHNTFIPTSISNNYIMIYIPKKEDNILIDAHQYDLDSTYILINPVTGTEESHLTNCLKNGTLLINKPDTNDWLAVFSLRSVNPSHSTTTNKISAIHYSVNRNSLSIDFTSSFSGTHTFGVFNMRGILLNSFSLSIAKQDDYHQYVQFKKSLSSGIYFLKDLSSNGIFLSKKMIVR